MDSETALYAPNPADRVGHRTERQKPTEADFCLPKQLGLIGCGILENSVLIKKLYSDNHVALFFLSPFHPGHPVSVDCSDHPGNGQRRRKGLFSTVDTQHAGSSFQGSIRQRRHGTVVECQW